MDDSRGYDIRTELAKSWQTRMRMSRPDGNLCALGGDSIALSRLQIGGIRTIEIAPYEPVANSFIFS